MEACRYCKSKKIALSGKVKGKQRFKCQRCKRYFSVQEKNNFVNEEKKKAIYENYKQHRNINLSDLATIHNISHATMYKWFSEEYWSDPQNKNSILSKLAKTTHYVKELIKYCNGVKDIINVKPFSNYVLIRYYKEGLETDSRCGVNLFTLRDIRQRGGEIYCTVKFNILITSKNKKPLYSSYKERREMIKKHQSISEPVNVQDFIKEFEEDDDYYIHKPNNKVKNILRNVTISDFINRILPNYDLAVTLGNIRYKTLEAKVNTYERIMRKAVERLKESKDA